MEDEPEHFGAQRGGRTKADGTSTSLGDDEPLLEIPPIILPQELDEWPQATIVAVENFEEKHRKLARAAESLTRMVGRRGTSAKYAEAVTQGVEDLRHNRFFVEEEYDPFDEPIEYKHPPVVQLRRPREKWALET